MTYRVLSTVLFSGPKGDSGGTGLPGVDGVNGEHGIQGPPGQPVKSCLKLKKLKKFNEFRKLVEKQWIPIFLFSEMMENVGVITIEKSWGCDVTTLTFSNCT